MPDTTHLRHVLLVEDLNDAADSLAMLLRLLGHRVDVARSGTEGLAMALATRPEVVLLDLGLPQMSGYEVASRLRTTGGFEDVLIIAITGYGMVSDRERSAAAGIDHHLLKPASLEDLERLLCVAPTASRRRASPPGLGPART
jgi:CheY-like chemotaxis protein